MKTLKSKVLFSGVVAACAFGGIALGIAWATPPVGLTATNIVGPITLDEFHTGAQIKDWGIEMKTRDWSDVYITHLKIAPGGHGGWHLHPGPSIITVRAGTATFYDECDNFERHQYPAGTGFVEDTGCVHLLSNEGTVDLEVVVVQLVPSGAPRRIDAPAP